MRFLVAILFFLSVGCHNVNNVNPTPADAAKTNKVDTLAKATDLPISVDTTFADTTSRKKTDVFVIIDSSKKHPTVKVISDPTLTEVFTAYMGVRELTGHNDGPEVEKFLASVGLGKGYPWCAAFVKTCLLQAGYKQAKAINGMAASCHRKDHLVYTDAQELVPFKSGDVITLWFGRLNRIGHTGFYERKINSTIIQTVEGNTNDAGSREGDGVYRKIRPLRTIYSISRWTD